MAAKTYNAGVRPYARTYYVPDHQPDDTELLCAFRIVPKVGVDMIEAAAAVAAESSTGTWTEVWSQELTNIDYYKAEVYRIQGDIAYIAYPMDLFEENSVVNIMFLYRRQCLRLQSSICITLRGHAHTGGAGQDLPGTKRRHL